MGLLGDVSDSALNWWREIRSGAPERARKARLREMLEDERFKWRSLDQLSSAIAADADTTKALLVQIGARPQEGNDRMWGLVARNPRPRG